MPGSGSGRTSCWPRCARWIACGLVLCGDRLFACGGRRDPARSDAHGRTPKRHILTDGDRNDSTRLLPLLGAVPGAERGGSASTPP